jgi:16S rRNA (uracil1498-N3)-methyltransferase
VVERMGRSDVDVTGAFLISSGSETRRAVHQLWHASQRLDGLLVEKLPELGRGQHPPLMTERVLRPKLIARQEVGPLARRAVAACGESGRNRVPVIHDVMTLADHWAIAAGNACHLVAAVTGRRYPATGTGHHLAADSDFF